MVGQTDRGDYITFRINTVSKNVQDLKSCKIIKTGAGNRSPNNSSLNLTNQNMQNQTIQNSKLTEDTITGT